ncbi:hypothetical protein AUK10_00415 [Candidatus Gracilibacteria bacterium CG2_30_37_12]|nr:MAG: hypothetical protein AUK10_00415 [Candidatus Gracilibacteria bacterium CG2_30_37_12]
MSCRDVSQKHLYRNISTNKSPHPQPTPGVLPSGASPKGARGEKYLSFQNFSVTKHKEITEHSPKNVWNLPLIKKAFMSFNRNIPTS